MMIRRRRAPGYSLTELMLVVTILGIIVSIGPMLMINLQNFYLLTTARNEIERDARASLDIMNRFIRQAKSTSVTIDTPSGQGPYSRIRFTHIDGRYMEFYQSGNQLLQVINSNTTTVSKNLIYIAFTYPQSDNPTIVSIAITMGKAIQLGRRKVLELTIQKVRIMN